MKRVGIICQDRFASGRSTYGSMDGSTSALRISLFCQTFFALRTLGSRPILLYAEDVVSLVGRNKFGLASR